MANPIVYVVINGELNMSPGKAAAQAVHASMMLSADSKDDFLRSYKRTVIVLEAKDTRQMMNLKAYLDEAGVDGEYYIDEGINQVDAYSITALAAYAGEDEEIREMFESFPLYQPWQVHYNAKERRWFNWGSRDTTKSA